ncbi:MAG: sporulation protein YabP [Clostridia bacterium]|nr:sporulation protein YabP [Clostridia bacterium]
MALNFDGERKIKHEIRLVGREEMNIGGVEEVISFDEETVHLKSVEGELYVEGKDIKIGTLDTDSGTVSLTGRISAMYYANDNGNDKKGFFSRLIH